MIKINRIEVKDVFLGHTEISKIYLNGDIVYIDDAIRGNYIEVELITSDNKQIYTINDKRVNLKFLEKLLEQEQESEEEGVIIPSKIIKVNTIPLHTTIKYETAGELRSRKVRDSRGRYIHTKVDEGKQLMVPLLKTIRKNRALDIKIEDLIYIKYLTKIANDIIIFNESEDTFNIDPSILTLEYKDKIQREYEENLINYNKEELIESYKDIFYQLTKYIYVCYKNNLENKIEIFGDILEEREYEYNNITYNYKIKDDIVKLPNISIIKKILNEWMPEVNNVIDKIHVSEPHKTKFIKVDPYPLFNINMMIRFNRDQIAYRYSITELMKELVIRDEENINIYKIVELSNEAKKEAQSNYDDNRDLYATSVENIGKYFPIHLSRYIEHMFYYRKKHRHVFNDIIEPYENIVNGVKYNYKFKDNIIFMNPDSIMIYLVNEWVPELRGIVNSWRGSYTPEYNFPELEESEYGNPEDIDDTMPDFSQIIPDTPVEIEEEEEEPPVIALPIIIDLEYENMYIKRELIANTNQSNKKIVEINGSEVKTSDNKSIETYFSRELVTKRAEKLSIEELSYCKALSSLINILINNENKNLNKPNILTFDIISKIQKEYEDNLDISLKRTLEIEYKNLIDSLSKYISICYYSLNRDKIELFSNIIEAYNISENKYRYKEKIANLTELDLISKIESEFIPELLNLITRMTSNDKIKTKLIITNPSKMNDEKRINRFNSEQLKYLYCINKLMDKILVYDNPNKIPTIKSLTDEDFMEVRNYYNTKSSLVTKSLRKNVVGYGDKISEYIKSTFFYKRDNRNILSNIIVEDNIIDKYNFNFIDYIKDVNSETFLIKLTNEWIPELRNNNISDRPVYEPVYVIEEQKEVVEDGVEQQSIQENNRDTGVEIEETRTPEPESGIQSESQQPDVQTPTPPHDDRNIHPDIKRFFVDYPTSLNISEFEFRNTNIKVLNNVGPVDGDIFMKTNVWSFNRDECKYIKSIACMGYLYGLAQYSKTLDQYPLPVVKELIRQQIEIDFKNLNNTEMISETNSLLVGFFAYSFDIEGNHLYKKYSGMDPKYKWELIDDIYKLNKEELLKTISGIIHIILNWIFNPY